MPRPERSSSEAQQQRKEYEALILDCTLKIRFLFGNQARAVAVQHQLRNWVTPVQFAAHVYLYDADGHPLEHDCPDGWPDLSSYLSEHLSDGWHDLTPEFRIPREFKESR